MQKSITTCLDLCDRPWARSADVDCDFVGLDLSDDVVGVDSGARRLEERSDGALADGVA